jgi:hypothetical protein
MIEIRYCGVCGDRGLVEKLKTRISESTEFSVQDIEEIECGSCSMEVTMDGETVFSEERELLDISGIVEQVRAGTEARA